MDNSLKPIEDFIRTGLAERFQKVFAAPLLFSQSPDGKQIASKMLKDRGLPAYPFAVAKISTLGITENSWKPNTLMRRGLKSRASHDNLLAYQLDLAPTDTTYEVKFYTQDLPSAIAFAKQWIFTCLRGTLKYTIRYAVADIDIDVDPDRTVNVPDRPVGLSEVKEYEIPVQITVHGYMSEHLKTTQAVDTLAIEISVLAEQGAKAQRVDILYKDWPSCSSCTETPTTPGEPGEGVDKTYVHQQTTLSSVWTVTHNLDKFPSVTITDESGNVVEATVFYPSQNVVIISFDMQFRGTAYLN